MSLFSQKKESNCVLAFDIGSGSVAGALVLTSETHPPTVLYNFRSEIPFQEEASGLRLLSLMLRSLSQVVLAITHEGFTVAGFGAHRPRIKEALVSLSAPWVVSKTSFLKLRSKEPVLMTVETFSTLLADSNAELASDKDIPKGAIAIEQKLIRSVLNGYPTASPYQKMALEAEFAVLGSFSVPRITEKVSDTITHLIHPKHISFHSFSLLAFATLRNLFPNEEDCILADVSGEQTELSVVKKGVLVETVSFPFGKNHLIRMLKESAKVPTGGASAFFKLYAEGSGTGKLFEKVKKVLEAAEKDWQEKFANMLSSFSEEMFLPKTLFLTADDDCVGLFKHAITSGEFSSFTVSPTSFSVAEVGNEMLAPLVSWAPSQNQDPFVSLIAAFANELRR